MPLPNPRILMINTVLTEEQVLNSFVDSTLAISKPITKDLDQNLNQSQQPIELNINVLDIWSSDDEEGGKIDLWRDDKGKAQPVAKTEEKSKGSKSEESEKKKEKSVEKEEEKADEVEKVKRVPRTLASVWELLMNSKVHREALVMALAHKKLPIACTPEEIINSLTESAPGTVIFTDDDLPLEGRDHHKALFIKVEVKGKLTTCVMVDNGSAINVCPLKILPKLGLTEADLKPSKVVIKAYDDTKKASCRDF